MTREDFIDTIQVALSTAEMEDIISTPEFCKVVKVLDEMFCLLDDADNYDVYGTEGWEHHVFDGE